MIDPAINLLVAIAFAALFAAAGLQKLRAPWMFIGTLAEYRIVPRALLWPAGAIVIALECALTMGLLFGTTRAASALAGAGLLLIYGGAIAINLLRGRRDIDCGCGAERRRISGWMVSRNVLLAAGLLTASLPTAYRTIGWIDVATVSGGVVVLVLLYAAFDTLAPEYP